MSEFKFLLDEHVGVPLEKALKRHSPDIVVWRIGEPGTPPIGTLDPDILIWCERRGFALVTNNRSTMPVHLSERIAAGRYVPPIFILNPKMSIGETAEELYLLWATAEPEEYADRLNYLPIP